MRRDYYLDLAGQGLRMPIGTDLILHEHEDAAAILHDGQRLGQVFESAARRFQTPLAFPIMDLMVEKTDLLTGLGVAPDQIDTHHFDECPDEEAVARLESHLSKPPVSRLRAQIEAIAHVAATDLLPIGMAIGPFSLMTKLIADPITAVYLAASGVSAADDAEVAAVERTLELSVMVILRSIQEQIEAGAKAIFIAEPAANKAYISPNQLEADTNIFDRYVLSPNRRIKSLMDRHGVDLIFHCCGELVDDMVVRFCTLDPAILSLGSSRILYEDARFVPKSTVLYGNLPSKKFFSDDMITADQVRQQAGELVRAMRRAGHPFILGTECDTLFVPGCQNTIARKIQAFMKGTTVNDLN
jgi:uroporphyrinogen-III decarboxylase